MNHFTNQDGYNAIVAVSPWLFRAAQPPGRRPFGAYFTVLPPGTSRLAKKLRIPRDKIAYVFTFVDRGDLIPLRGGRGAYISYSPADYAVEKDRQVYAGKA
jgi:hypothetical protein